MLGTWHCWLQALNPSSYARRQPLILINGLAEQGESWFRNVRYWRRHFDVHMPNILAYEGDALHRRIDLGQPIDIDYLVEQLHQYLEQYVQAKPYHLVAASLGGKIAVEYAVRYPQHVNRVVLLCTSGLGDVERLPIIEGVRRSDLKTLVDSVFENTGRVDVGLLDYYQRQFANRRWRSGLLRTIRGTMDHCVRDRLSQLSQPTLLISAAQDKVVDPKCAQEAAKLIPRGQFHMVPHCGHAPQMERPWLVNRLVLHFLTASDPTPKLRLARLLFATANTIL